MAIQNEGDEVRSNFIFVYVRVCVMPILRLGPAHEENLVYI